MPANHPNHVPQLLAALESAQDTVARAAAVGELLSDPSVGQRLRRVCRAELRRSFPRLAFCYETGDVAQELALKLTKHPPILPGAESAQPPVNADETRIETFFRYIGRVARNVLIDWSRKKVNDAKESLKQDEERAPALDPGTQTHDPALLAEWSEFHDFVARLPEEDRALVRLLHYEQLTQAEAARKLGLPISQVQRRWVRLCREFRPYLPAARDVLTSTH